MYFTYTRSRSSNPEADSTCNEAVSAVADVELYLVSPAVPNLALAEKLEYAWYDPNTSGLGRAYQE